MVLNLNKYQSLIEKKKNLSDEKQIFEVGKLIGDIETVDVNQTYRKAQQKVYSKGRILKIYTSISRYAAILIFLFYMVYCKFKSGNYRTGNYMSYGIAFSGYFIRWEFYNVAKNKKPT